MLEADNSGYLKIQLQVSPFARTDAKFKAELRPRFSETQMDVKALQQRFIHHCDRDLEVGYLSIFSLVLSTIRSILERPYLKEVLHQNYPF